MSVAHNLLIEPIDPIVARDGRPFGLNSGLRMRSLPWPYPSVVAGSFRTALGKSSGGTFDSLIPTLKRVRFRGPFPGDERMLHLPAPADCITLEDGSVQALRPLRVDPAVGGVDLPRGLSPVCLPANAPRCKPRHDLPNWWSTDVLARWLTEEDAASRGFATDGPGFLDDPPQDERTHVAIDPLTLAGLDRRLFTTTGLEIARMLARVELDQGAAIALADDFDVIHPLGGERRLARFRRVTSTQPDPWTCPTPVRDALARRGVERIRMILATPAAFAWGWLPSWIDPGTLEGRVHGIGLRLVGVCNARWRAISGWSYERKGPKRTWRLVPAGAVYYLESTEPDTDTTALADSWLHPVGDELGEDGLGLAVWGTWEWGHP